MINERQIDEIKELKATEILDKRDHLDQVLRNLVSEHPFTISGGALIIGITILKIIKKLRGK
jgi:hypothetical protein